MRICTRTHNIVNKGFTVVKTRTFNEPRIMSVGSRPMENMSRMIVERINVSTAGRRGTVNTNAPDTNIVVHRRPDSLGSRSVHGHRTIVYTCDTMPVMQLLVPIHIKHSLIKRS